MKECLFCQIAEGTIPSEKVFESRDILAFRDINPKAPTHILIIPRKHISSVAETKENDAEVLGNLVLSAKQIAADEKVESSGYRLVFNVGSNAGQAVDHIHLHLLGGRKLQWPPG